MKKFLLKRGASKRALKIYSITSFLVTLIPVAYLMLLYFPQPLFAYSKQHGRFNIHSQRPIDADVEKAFDRAEELLVTSPIYDEKLQRHIYLTDSHGMYAFLSHKAWRSFGNSAPFINNVFINKSDPARDLVFIPRDFSNQRSLSGVIADEVIHLLIRKRYGTLAATMKPEWKVEGYCEYVARESTIPLEEGIRRWKENPGDDNGYRYTKYHAMIKYLIESETLSVDDIFTQDLDPAEVARKSLESYK